MLINRSAALERLKSECLTSVCKQQYNLFIRFFNSTVIREAWNKKRTLNGNLYDMGLVSDISQVLAIPTAKQQRLKQIKEHQSGFLVEDLEADEKAKKAPKATAARTKKHIVDDMERDANALRESGYR